MAERMGSGEGPSRAGELVAGLLGGALGRGLGDAQRAARAWYAANGDRERAHTTGVYLRKAGRAGQDPVLVVVVDSGLLAADLGTNKDIYLQRIAMRGVAVSDIRFRVGPPAVRPTTPARKAEAPCPPRDLSSAEEERVDRACADLPDGLREAAARAMRATMARRG